MNPGPMPRPLCDADREAFNARMAANYARINERPRDVIRRHADLWPLIVAGGMIGGAFLMQLTGWGW